MNMFTWAIMLAAAGSGLLAPDMLHALGYSCILFAVIIALTTRRT